MVNFHGNKLNFGLDWFDCNEVLFKNIVDFSPLCKLRFTLFWLIISKSSHRSNTPLWEPAPDPCPSSSINLGFSIRVYISICKYLYNSLYSCSIIICMYFLLWEHIQRLSNTLSQQRGGSLVWYFSFLLSTMDVLILCGKSYNSVVFEERLAPLLAARLKFH